MKSLWKTMIQSALVAGLATGLAGTLSAEELGQAGVVRISKPKSTEAAGDQVTPTSAMMYDENCNATASAPCTTTGPVGSTSGGVSSMGPAQVEFRDAGAGRQFRKYSRQDWRYSDWGGNDCWGSSLHRRTQRHSLAMENMYGRTTGYAPCMYYHDPSGQDMCDYFRCKFGYFFPSGAGGAGLPWVGHYGRVYPVNPYHNDSRDGQVWAAQGYGIPMAVPLAPVVGHTYEYGWGVPSSRLVPVSHPAY